MDIRPLLRGGSDVHSFDRHQPEAYPTRLEAGTLNSHGIATRPGAHCAPRMHEALGTVQQGAVRFSFSVFNTEEEIDAAIAAVAELARE